MNRHELGRRSFLSGGLALAGGFLLPSCGSGGGGDAPGDTGGEPAEPPSFIPYGGVTPDLPPDPTISLPGGYFSYPANPPTFIEGDVGGGGEVRILIQAAQIAVPVERNTWWQQLNERLGAELTFEVAMPGDWDAKQATTLAGGDLADIMQMRSMPRMLQALQSEFADLTEYLSGDAIKDYPSLAAIPGEAWRTPTFNGRIYGIAQPRPLPQRVCNFRADIVDQLGLSAEISDGEAFVDLCRELTDPRQNRWAIGSEPAWWLLFFLLEMMGAPNRWQEEGGEFTSVFESEQMPEALDVARRMWDEGLLHPDSMTGNSKDMWFAGSTVLYLQDFAAWSARTRENPGFDIGIIPGPNWQGGGLAAKHFGPASYPDFLAFKKAEPERIQELLRIADYLAAPFGTAEHLLVNYGVEGADYTLDGTDPAATEQGDTERPPIGYFTTRNVALYVPGHRDLVQEQYDYLKQILPDGKPDPTLGLYSETAMADGQRADQTLRDLQNEIILGRRDLSEWEDAVDAWRRNAGDAMREEYAEALKAAADA